MTILNIVIWIGWLVLALYVLPTLWDVWYELRATKRQSPLSGGDMPPCNAPESQEDSR